MRLRTILLSSTYLLPITSLAITNPPATLITLPAHNLTLSSAIDPECVRITDPPMVGLNPTNCEVGIDIICSRLPHQGIRDRWIWSELPGCALGYYLPDELMAPFVGTCVRAFEKIVNVCATDSRFNAGGINVAEMPDFSGRGRAERERMMRYAMAPERLTLPY